VKDMEPYEQVTITNFSSMCEGEKSASLQSTTPEGNTKSLIAKWDPKKDTYETIITLLPEVTSPPFRSINSCAINPIDYILYCSMEINGRGSFLVRIQDKKVGFVDKLAGWRFSAAFDERDNYYSYGEHSVHPPLGRMSVIANVSKMPAWSSWSGVDAQAETKNANPSVSIWEDGVERDEYRMGADMAYLKWDLDTKGKKGQVYMASLIGDKMKLLRISPEPYELFTLETDKLPKDAGPNGKPRVWGTAWAYRSWKNAPRQHELYFSADDGKGLFATQAENIVWSTDPKKVFINELEGVKKRKTDWNDGISCGSVWGPNPDKCTYHMYRSTTVDRFTDNRKSAFEILDYTTGKVEKTFPIEADGLKAINSCAINPKDSIIYCTMQMENGNWLARLDTEGKIGYVMKVAEWNHAATFDLSGNYWFYDNTGGLNKVENLDKKKSIKHLGFRKTHPEPSATYNIRWSTSLLNIQKSSWC